jgi:malonyl-CoA/methylmalonyl-CoA synthetase
MSNNANLYIPFYEAMKKSADIDFLRVPAGPSLGYDETHARCGQYQAALAAAGVRKGDRVVVQVEKSIEAVLLYLACLRAGAIYVPLNTAYTAAEVGYFIGDAEPALFVCDPAVVDSLDADIRDLLPQVMTLAGDGSGSLTELANSEAANDEIVDCKPNALAAILYTSGTTGRSKGAMLSHGNLASNAITLHQYWHFQPGDVLLHALPIFHVHGLFVALHTALLNGSTILFLAKYDVDQVMQLLPEATVMMGVPTFYTRLLDREEFGREHCRNMRLFVSGSAPLLAETHVEFEQRTGHRILERYGMTETNMITSNPYDGERIAGTVGFALPGVSVRIADNEGKLLAAGETGILEVSGPNVFSGYWRMPEKTAAEFRDDGWFITGDLARMDADGRVTIVGREKDLVISGGYNVYPKEVEMVIDEIAGVKESAVIGAPHPDFGESVVAVVVCEPGAKLVEQDITGALAGKLARFKQPRHIAFIDVLPRNTMGKVQKAALREQFRAVFQ